MQRFFRHPEEEQCERDDHEFFLGRLHGAEGRAFLADRLVAARDFHRFRRQHLEADEVEDDGHDDGIRRRREEPFGPRDRRAELFLNEAEGDHVLRGRRLDADVPDARRLDGRDHEQGGEAAVFLHLEGRDDAEDNWHDAADARRGARHEEGEDEADEDHAREDAVCFRADLREDEEGDAPVKPRVHHGRREEECRTDEHGAVARDAAERHADGF